MSKSQKIRHIFDKLFRVKTAVILWIVQAILYGLCLFFNYVINVNILMDIFAAVSGPVNIVAYVSSAGAIIRTFANRDLAVKRKLLAVILIVAVYFGTSGIIYLAFNNVAEEVEAERERILEQGEIEAGEWKGWTTEDSMEKLQELKWGEIE